MAENTSPSVETCLYPVYSDSDGLSMLLGLQREGPNQGRWVPIGRPLKLDEFAWQVANYDLIIRGFEASSLRFAGLVTEVSYEGWQIYLTLFVARQRTKRLPQPDEFATQYAWITPEEAGVLSRPQSDALFDYSFLLEDTTYCAGIRFNEVGRASLVYAWMGGNFR